MRANDPQSGNILDPNVTIDMIYAQLHIRLLHTTYTSFENFSCMGPRGVVVRIYEEDYYIMLHKNNIKLVDLEKMVFFIWSIVSLWLVFVAMEPSSDPSRP